MALTLSKQFMRVISQNPNENQTGISLWTLADVEKAQAKQRELALEQEAERRAAAANGAAVNGEDDDDDEYWDGGLDDAALGALDLDV